MASKRFEYAWDDLRWLIIYNPIEVSNYLSLLLRSQDGNIDYK